MFSLVVRVNLEVSEINPVFFFEEDKVRALKRKNKVFRQIQDDTTG